MMASSLYHIPSGGSGEPSSCLRSKVVSRASSTHNNLTRGMCSVSQYTSNGALLRLPQHQGSKSGEKQFRVTQISTASKITAGQAYAATSATRTRAGSEGRANATATDTEVTKSETESIKEEVTSRVKERMTQSQSPPSDAPASDSPARTRKASPLERGGTLTGKKAAGKDASAGYLTKATGGADEEKSKLTFSDKRFVNGTWDKSQFPLPEGQKNFDGSTTDWDAMITAEARRRRILEVTPQPVQFERELVTFDTNEIPWWAWVKRFHLPQAEQTNGRAAMIGFASAWAIDATFHVGPAELLSHFPGQLAAFLTFAAIAIVRNLDDLDNLKELWAEARLYDSQWDAAWTGVERPDVPDDK